MKFEPLMFLHLSTVPLKGEEWKYCLQNAQNRYQREHATHGLCRDAMSKCNRLCGWTSGATGGKSLKAFLSTS